MHTLIRSLPGSLTHQISTGLYQRHRDAGNGACATCDQPMPCPARANAARVIAAAGEDPHAYEYHPAPTDTALTVERSEPDQPPSPEQPPHYTGYRLGRRNHTLPTQAFQYERDDP